MFARPYASLEVDAACAWRDGVAGAVAARVAEAGLAQLRVWGCIRGVRGNIKGVGGVY